MQQSFFSGNGKRIELNSENVSLLEYEDETTAAAEAQFISPDGYGYTSADGTRQVQISWTAPPHFYRAGRIIVLYAARGQTIDLLDTLWDLPSWEKEQLTEAITRNMRVVDDDRHGCLCMKRIAIWLGAVTLVLQSLAACSRIAAPALTVAPREKWGSSPDRYCGFLAPVPPGPHRQRSRVLDRSPHPIR